MEKEISWEVLLNIKTQIFIAENDDTVVWENPHLSADYAKKKTEGKLKDSKVDESFVEIQKSANKFLQQRKGDKLALDKIVEETKENEDEKASPLKIKDEVARGQALDQAKVDDKQMTFHSQGSEEEDEGEGEEEE